MRIQNYRNGKQLRPKCTIKGKKRKIIERKWDKKKSTNIGAPIQNKIIT